MPGFQILDELGRGGMGVVWRARDLSLDREVALKFLSEKYAANSSIAARFVEEARITGQLQHPGIPAVYQVGKLEDDRPYLAMKLIKGRTLHDLLQDRSEERNYLAIFEAVCHAVGYAHARNVIHRDLKPANVMVGAFGEVQVMDWGLAKVVHNEKNRPHAENTEVGAVETEIRTQRVEDGHHTQAGTIVGTLAFMPPEQALGEIDRVDQRSDVFALGGILCAILTGKPPYEAASAEAIRVAAVRGKLDDAMSRLDASGAEAGLIALAKNCLAFEQQDRPSNADAVAETVAQLRMHAEKRAQEAELERARAEMQTAEQRKRRRMQLTLLGAIALSMSAGGVGIYLKYREATTAVIERDQALGKRDAAIKAEQERVNERDAALKSADARDKELTYRLGLSDMLLAINAYEKGDIRMAREGLENVPFAQRKFEWHYLARQAEGGLFTLYGHTRGIHGVAFSPDGNRIVTASSDETAKIWDTRSGRLLSELKGHTANVKSACFSLDGSRIVTTSLDKTAKVWDARTLKSLFELKGHTEGVTSATFSPDGSRIVTSSWDKTAKVWDARIGTPIFDLQVNAPGARKIISSVSFSPDGSRIVAGTWDNTAKVWDARNGEKLHDLVGHTGYVTSVCFSPDGSRIVTGSKDKSAIVWHAHNFTPLLKLKGHSDEVTSVSYSPDAVHIVTGSNDKTANVWDAREGALLLKLKGHTEEVNAVSFSPDGNFVLTGSQDGTAKLWDCRHGTFRFETEETVAYLPLILFGCFNADRTRFVTAGSGPQVWDLRTGAQQLQLKTNKGELVLYVLFSPDGERIATCSLDGNVKLWDARNGMLLTKCAGHKDRAVCASFSPDGKRLLTGSVDNTAKLWDAQTGDLLLNFDRHNDGVTSVAHSSDGLRIVTGCHDGMVKVWDTTNGTLLVELKGHASAIFSSEFNLDGTRIVTGSEDKTAKVWDSVNGSLLLDLKGHAHWVTEASFSRDGTRILTGSEDKTAKVWDAKTGTPFLQLNWHGKSIGALEFSLDGECIFAASDDNPRVVWESRIQPGRVILSGHKLTVTSASFSPDGTRIVTGSEDRSAKVWDVKSGKALYDLIGHAESVRRVSYSPDGSRIVTGGWYRTAKVWDAATGNLLFDLNAGDDSIGVLDVAFSQDGTRIVTSKGDVKKVWDARNGMELRDEPIPPLLAITDYSPDHQKFAFRDQNRVCIVPAAISSGLCLQRLIDTRPNVGIHRELFDNATKEKNAFAAAFHLDRLLAYSPSDRILSLLERAKRTVDQPLISARTSIHTAGIADSSFSPVLFFAYQRHPLSLRLLGGLLIRNKTPTEAIAPLKSALLLREGDRPPVEELLLALAFADMKQPDEAKRWLDKAALWLDRYKTPFQITSALGCAPSGPLFAATEMVKTPLDPRYNPFDWETWHECDVFRDEVEKKLGIRR